MHRNERSNVVTKSTALVGAIALFAAVLGAEARATERVLTPAIERRVDGAKPHYAPGEIIVKLRGDAGAGAGEPVSWYKVRRRRPRKRPWRVWRPATA